MTDNHWSYTKTNDAGRRSSTSMGASHKRIKPHCPWQNGKVERFNRTLQTEWAYRKVFDVERRTISRSARLHPPLQPHGDTTPSEDTHPSAACHQPDGQVHLGGTLEALAPKVLTDRRLGTILTDHTASDDSTPIRLLQWPTTTPRRTRSTMRLAPSDRKLFERSGTLVAGSPAGTGNLLLRQGFLHGLRSVSLRHFDVAGGSRPGVVRDRSARRRDSPRRTVRAGQRRAEATS